MRPAFYLVFLATLINVRPLFAITDREVADAFVFLETQERYHTLPMTLSKEGDAAFENLFKSLSEHQILRFREQFYPQASNYFSGEWNAEKTRIAASLLKNPNAEIKAIAINSMHYISDPKTVALRQKTYRSLLVDFIETPIELPNPSKEWFYKKSILEEIHLSSRESIVDVENIFGVEASSGKTPATLIESSELEGLLTEDSLLSRYNLASLRQLPLNEKHKKLLHSSIKKDLEQAQRLSREINSSGGSPSVLTELEHEFSAALSKDGKKLFNDVHRWDHNPNIRSHTLAILFGSNNELWQNPELRQSIIDFVQDPLVNGGESFVHYLSTRTEYDVHKDQDYRKLIGIAAQDSRYQQVLQRSLAHNPRLLFIPEMAKKYTDEFLDGMASTKFSAEEMDLLTIFSDVENSKYNQLPPLFLVYIKRKYPLMPQNLRMKIALNMIAKANSIASQVPEPQRTHFKDLGRLVLKDPDQSISDAYAKAAYSYCIPKDAKVARGDLIEAHKEQALRGQAQAALLHLASSSQEYEESRALLGLNEVQAAEKKASFAPKLDRAGHILKNLFPGNCKEALD